MREVVIHAYCDACAEQDGTRTPAGVTFTLDIAEGEGAALAPRMLDVCEAHARVLADLAALTRERGAAVTPRTAAKAAAAHRKPCPVLDCAFTGANVHSLRDHVRNVHHTTLSKLGGGKRIDCPHCGESCANGTGLSAHIRGKHPETIERTTT